MWRCASNAPSEPGQVKWVKWVKCFPLHPDKQLQLCSWSPCIQEISRVLLPRKAVCNQLFLSSAGLSQSCRPLASKLNLFLAFFFSPFIVWVLVFCSHPAILFCFLFSFCHPPAASFNLCLYRINLFGRSTYLFLSNSLSRSAYP